MMSLDEMHEFVNNDIFEAFFRLLGEFGVETDSSGNRVAATPLGLHPPHVESAYRDVEPGRKGAERSSALCSDTEIHSGFLSRSSLEKVLPDAPKCTKMAVFGYELGYELDWDLSQSCG